MYNWAKNAGYLTKEHLDAIDKHGLCKYHRPSFLRKHFEKQLTLIWLISEFLFSTWNLKMFMGWLTSDNWIENYGKVAQLARAFGSYPRGREFESLPCYFFLSFLGWFAERKFLKKNTIGIADDYIATTSSAKSGDIIYLDPPYFHTKGRYFGTINFERFLNYLEDLNKRNINYILSFDGLRGEANYTVNIPKDLYKRHELLQSGNSTFKKVIGKETEKVFESLYMNF